MTQKRSRDGLVIERKQRIVNQQSSYVAQSCDADALDIATPATDADVQVMWNLGNPSVFYRRLFGIA